LTTEELAAVKAYAEVLYTAIDTPTEDDQAHYAYITALGTDGDTTQPGEEIDPLVDTVTIDGQTYEIPFEINAEGVRVVADVDKLIDADLALLEWDAKGNSTEDAASATRVTGVFKGETVPGYWKVYDKIYALLKTKLYYTYESQLSSGASKVSADETRIYALGSGNVLLHNSIDLKVSGTLIIIAENTASLNLQYSRQIQVLDGGTLVIQGPSQTKKIIIKPQNSSSTRSSSAIDVINGKLYLNAC